MVIQAFQTPPSTASWRSSSTPAADYLKSPALSCLCGYCLGSSCLHSQVRTEPENILSKVY